MGLVIAASAIAFVTTEMDDLLVTFVLFCKAGGRRENASVIIGKYLGLYLLIAAGKLRADALGRLPCRQLLGMLGLLPVVLGIRYAVKEYAGEGGAADGEGSGVRPFGIAALILEAFLITLASGGDSVAICPPFFSSLDGAAFACSCVAFSILQALWCVIGISVMNAASIRSYTEESKAVIIPVLFIALGLYVLIQNGTVVWLLSAD